ncbi:MAG: hypothetical protein NVS2B14_03420 [Chamaesiphon sp.]
MEPDFEPPAKGLSALAIIGGFITAAGLIYSLELVRQQPMSTHSTQATQAKQNAFPRSVVRSSQLSHKAIAQKAAACSFNQAMYPNTGMTFEIKSFYSQAMQQERKYGLILPPDYYKHPNRDYPVIFLLHGGHGDAGGWEICGAATEVLDKLYKSGKLPPAIVITPDGNDLRGSSPLWDPEYFNGPHGQVDTLIGSELVNLVKTKYRTLKNPQYWSIGGYSSGGWGALLIGLRHLNNFHTLFSISGYFTDVSGPNNSPANLVQNLSPTQHQVLRVYLNAGANDAKFLVSTKQFAQILKRLNITYELQIDSGGHGTKGINSGWYYWHEHLTDALTYVGEQLSIQS